MKLHFLVLFFFAVVTLNIQAQTFIQSNKINYQFLATSLENSGFVIKINKKSYLLVSKDNHNPIYIDISEDKRLIVFKILYGIKQNADFSKVDDLVERINSHGSIKASVSKEYDIITLEYYFWMKGGMIVENFIAAVNMFNDTEFKAEIQWDEERVIR